MATGTEPDPAEYEAAGIYDPGAADASQRLALLNYLSGLGATMGEIAAALPDEVGALSSDLALWRDRERLTLDEVAEAAAVDKALISRTWRAAGLPEPDPDPGVRTFSRPDVEILATMRIGIEYFGEDVTIQLIRVLGAAAARVADASVSAFIVNVLPQAFEEDPSGLELARANANSIGLIDGMTLGFDAFLRHHIERGYRPIGATDAAPGVDLVRRSIGFADLVDSTAWTQQLELASLSKALSTFDSTASEIVVERGGRVVKLIGDSVMFMSEDPVAGIEIALGLADAFASHDVLPPVRVGLATGDVVARDGDYSGAVVNLAARAVTIAHPSALLVDPVTMEAIDGAAPYECRTAGDFVLKGFDEPVRLTRVQRRVAA